MSDNYNDDFDNLFQQDQQDAPLSGAQVRQIERIASEQVMRGYQALQQGVAVVQQMTADAARKTEKAHPGFLERYQNTEICRRFIEQRPAVARAILNAEAGQGTDSLAELYDIFDESARTYEQPSNRGSLTPAPEGTASTLSLQQINALPLEKRHQAIRDLGDRVGDLPIDAADSSNEVFKIERGEGGE